MSVNEPVAPVLTLRDRIDEVCDAFEQAWQTEERPQIAAFVALGDKEARAALFSELLLVELEFRLNRGEEPMRDEYLETFPEFSEQIAAIDFEHVKNTLPATVGLNVSDTPGSAPLQPGTPIAHFQLLEKIGAGAMGEVWKAWDTRLQRPVAIKLPRPGQLTEADLHRFLREGRAAAQLRHPQLAAVHDAGREGDLAYIVADYVEGDDLKKYLAKQRLDFSAAAALCADVAEALHHAHERGVVHRDLKPANIIIDKDGRPHVIDFGLAKWSSDDRELTVKGELLGTPAYMAPEQARGDVDDVGPSSDVYAVGAMLYELIAGRCPFSGGKVAVLQAIISADPEPPRHIDPTIPRDLETICLKAIEKDQKKRYRSAQEMAVDLRRFVRGEPILARRVGRAEKTWRWLRRRPAVAASLMLIALLIIAGFAVNALVNRNYELQGYRPMLVTTSPAGARIAIVPVDEGTGEPIPDPAAIIRPDGTTPLTVELKPGRYFVEAVLPGSGDVPDFAEVYQTVPETQITDRAQAKMKWSAFYLPAISIGRTQELVKSMIPIRVSEAARRRNPMLPNLLYVEAKESSPADYRPGTNNPVVPTVVNDEGNRYIPFESAVGWAEKRFTRLPSAAEYDAIVQAIKRQSSNDLSGGKATLSEDLFGGVAEWTTTKYQLPHNPRPNLDQRILKGYGDPDAYPEILRSVDGQLLSDVDDDSPLIGFRCVRSGAPRFVTE